MAEWSCTSGTFIAWSTGDGSSEPLEHADPVTQTIVALLCGGIAFTGHSSKAATRLLVNHSPEPFTNIGLSLGEGRIRHLFANEPLAHTADWIELNLEAQSLL